MPRLPPDIEHRIVAKLYADAQRLDWLHVNQAEHKEQYASWLKEPSIGGVLFQFMTPERARVWIKDGPMKEYSRALAGAGKYARFVEKEPISAHLIIRASLGEEWSMVPGSQGIKPLHCAAKSHDRTIHVFWGPAKDFKHLLWAALLATDGRSMKEAQIVVVHSIEDPIISASKSRHIRLGLRCGIAVAHIQLNTG